MSLSTNFPTIRPTLLLDFAKSRTVDPRITFTRASTATYFDEDGILQSAAADRPRIDFNPSTLVCNGLLIEEQRTNLLLYSEELDTGWTNGSAATWQFNSGVAPDGATTALGVDGLSGFAIISSGTTLYRTGTAISSSTAYTFSIFVRTKTGTATNIALRINETGGNSTVSSAFTVTTNWQRISLSVTSAAGATAVTVLLGTLTGTADLYIWGAQLEAGAFPTSYIPTTTTALTRNADVATMTGTNFSSWYNASEGTFVNEFSSFSTATHGIIYANNGAVNEAIRVFYNAAVSTYAYSVRSSASEQSSITNLGALSVSSVIKIATAYKVNDLAASRNGAAALTDTSATLPTGIDRLEIGVTQAANTNLNGHIRRLTYYPARLVNAQLQALTL